MAGQKPRRGRPPAFDEHALLDAAVSVIERDGLESTTVKAVAAELDVTAMAIYRFCDSKDDLLDRVPDFLAAGLGSDIEAAEDGVGALRALAESLGAVLDRHPGCAPLFHRPHVGPNMGRLAATIIDRLCADGLTPERAAGLLRATVALVVGLRVTGGASAEQAVGAMADDAIDVWLRGVAGELRD